MLDAVTVPVMAASLLATDTAQLVAEHCIVPAMLSVVAALTDTAPVACTMPDTVVLLALVTDKAQPIAEHRRVPAILTAVAALTDTAQALPVHDSDPTNATDPAPLDNTAVLPVRVITQPLAQDVSSPAYTDSVDAEMAPNILTVPLTYTPTGQPAHVSREVVKADVDADAAVTVAPLGQPCASLLKRIDEVAVTTPYTLAVCACRFTCAPAIVLSALRLRYHAWKAVPEPTAPRRSTLALFWIIAHTTGAYHVDDEDAVPDSSKGSGVLLAWAAGDALLSRRSMLHTPKRSYTVPAAPPPQPPLTELLQPPYAVTDTVNVGTDAIAVEFTVC